MKTPKHEFNVKFGRLLAKHRKALGLSQGAFAAKACIAESSVAQMEAGTYDPSFEMVRKLASELNIDPSELFSDNFTKADAKGKIVLEIVTMLKKSNEKTLLRVRDVVAAMLK